MVGSSGFYRCSIINGGCGSVGIKSTTLEDHVYRTAHDRIPENTEDEEPSAPSADEVILGEISALEGRLEELSDQFTEGSTFVAKTAVKVEAEIAKLRKQLAGEVQRSGESKWSELAQWATPNPDPEIIAAIHDIYAGILTDITVKKGRGVDPSKRVSIRWAR